MLPRRVLSTLKIRSTSRLRAGRRRREAVLQGSVRDCGLEERLMMTGGVPIPLVQLNNPNLNVALSTIFWNGGAPLNTVTGKAGVSSPAASGAMKTITFTNYSPNTAYPFLRTANGGQDPNDSTKNGPQQGFYDPQDLQNKEFREYLGYSKGGKDYLGVPPGATIKFQVPLVLWDGDNLSLVEDGTYLTASGNEPGAHIFNYNKQAKITVVGTKPVSGTVWVQGSAHYPQGETPLVMFYFADTKPATVPNDAPAQLAEVTFRDPYLRHFIKDSFQTFALINYDVSYVNTLVAPAAIEASNVPITSGAVASNNLTYYRPNADFGWNGSTKGAMEFNPLVADFVHNKGKASIGQYFGGKGWPQYYNPNKNTFVIPSGANVFDNSPLVATNATPPVNVSNYDSNRWLLSSAGGGDIQASAGGLALTEPNPTSLSLLFTSQAQKAQFAADIASMKATNQKIYVTAKTATNVYANVGTLSDYQPTASGGTATVNITQALPTNIPFTFVFQRNGSDYASTAITNLWYSWAQYYVNQYANFNSEPEPGKYVFASNVLTNQITLDNTPTVPLAVGMTVTAPSLRQDTTILKIVGNTIYLSQIPKLTANTPETFVFGAPQALTIDANSANYTKPYTLSFSPTETPNAIRFAGSVYEAMAVEAVAAPPPAYLPDTMNVVDNVIKYYAKILTYNANSWGPTLVGEVRDIVKSILRGVYDYYQIPDQNLWYPNPSLKVPGQMINGKQAQFNVFNLDPYVWFVHKIEDLSGYGFSVDDDVANPAAGGPRDDNTNHAPSNIQMGFAGIKGTGALSFATPLVNQKEWFPTTKWGFIDTTASIGIQQTGQYKGYSVITLTGKNVLRTLNQIITPGPGQVGAFITAPGYIVPGTTLIFFPDGVQDPTKAKIILSQNAISTNGKSIPVRIDAAQMIIPTVPLKNPIFAFPEQKSAPFYRTNPTGPFVGWKFTGDAGVAGLGSKYTTHNLPPVGAQVGFIGKFGSISQSVNLAPNTPYAVSFLVAERQLDDGSINQQTLAIKVDGRVVGTFTPTATTDGSFVLFNSDAFKVPTAGPHEISIVGTNKNGGDNTALIDKVVVTGRPAAATGGPAPELTLGAASIEGPELRDTGSVAGANSSGLSTTVDYGDGTGRHRLPLSPTGTFNLDHRFTQPGTFTVVVDLSNSRGIVDTEALKVTATGGAPLVSGFGIARDAFVAELYSDNLGRAPDASTLKSLSGRLAAGASLASVVKSVWGSAEHKTLVKEGVVRPITFQQAFTDALRAGRQAARLHRPPTGPVTIKLNP